MARPDSIEGSLLVKNRSRPAGTVVPTLIYDDVPDAVDWLCNAFGFRLRIRAGRGHAQLAIGGGSMMLGQSRTEAGPDGDALVFAPPDDRRVSQSIFVAVDDVDAHHRRAVAAGARIAQAPTDHMFGERQYTAFDLAGYRWTFSQSIADVDPASWGAETMP
jgi:uncharacterized glyoxalase superfamily protein PhnB